MNIALLSVAKSIHTVKIANGLALLGHNVKLFSLPNHQATKDKYDDRVKIHYLKKGGFFGYFLNKGELKRELKKFNADIINAHYVSGYGTLARLASFKPCLISVWGSDIYDFPYKNSFCRRLVEKNLEFCDCIASTSHAMKEQTKKVYTKNDKEIFVTPFGVDLNIFYPRPNPKDDNGLRVGIVKSLDDKYGISYLIKAFAMVLENAGSDDILKNKNISLYIYGDGPGKNEYEQLAKDLNIADNVYFCGPIPNTQVAEVISKMDVFASPSIQESFGVAAVEAMACGVPVVATDADGFMEVIEDKVTGFIVEKKNEKALFEKISLLLKDKNLRLKMGESGIERVKRLYSWDNNLKQLEQAIVSTYNKYNRKQNAKEECR